MRASILLALLALAAFPTAAGAAGATLGASLVGVPVYFADGRVIEVVNRSQLAERFDAQAGGGWGVSPATGEIAPGGRAVLTLTAGPDTSLLTVRIRAAVPVPGTQEGSIILAAGLHPGSRPVPAFPILPMLAALGAVLLGLIAWRYRRHA